MAKFIALAFALVAFSACEVDGTLTVQQPLTMTAKKNKSVTLQPGSYRAEVEAHDDKLEIEVKVGRDEKKITLRPADGQTLPKRNGQIFIPASQSGQSFDLNGVVNTVSVNGNKVWADQSCTAYRPVYVCQTVVVGYDRYGNPIWRQVCRTENQPYPGRQEIEYYPVTTTTDVDMAFLNPGTTTQLAEFGGTRTTVRNVYTYRGPCRLYGYSRF